MTELTDITKLVEAYTSERTAPLTAEIAQLEARIAELEKPEPVPTPEPEPVPVPEASWKLLWHEPFDKLDTTVWSVDVNTTYGSGNQHEQVNTNRPKNVRIQDGALIVEAHRENPPIVPTGSDPLKSKYPNGRPYSSGHLKSKKTFTIGDKPMRFEVRAKVPQGPGLLPSPLWLRPTTGGSDGEIDVMESDTTTVFQVVQTAHQQYSPSVKAGKSVNLTTPNTEYHTYGAEVDDTGITFYIDGKFIVKVGKDKLPRYDELFGAPRQWLMHITNAVGGTWVKAPTAATPFPAPMTVGWIKVYEKS